MKDNESWLVIIIVGGGSLFICETKPNMEPSCQRQEYCVVL